ncbi:AP-3 complex subunit mu-1, partial [Lunasporangiospora selenospora]
KVIIEKHWHELIPRRVVDFFNDQVSKSLQSNENFSRDDILPIIPSPKYQLINIYRDGLTYLSPVSKEVDPMTVFEFLHRIPDILREYFGSVSETIIKENFVTVYQLLEEMIDDGFPLTTEPNALRDAVPPPTIFNKVMSTVGGTVVAAVGSSVSATVAGGLGVVGSSTGGSSSSSSLSSRLNTAVHGMSNLPWRRAGVKYTRNEIFLDILEEVDAIVDSTGRAVTCEAHGVIQTMSRLSGMPDVTVNFVNPRLVDDCSFHPSVRFNKWETDKVLSFIPPDGQFPLMSYRVNMPNQQTLPLQIKPSFSAGSNVVKFDISVNIRNTDNKPLEDVVLTIPLQKSTTTLSAKCNQGQYMFDPVTKILRWDIGTIQQKERAPLLSGSFNLNPANGEVVSNTGYNINVAFTINSHSMSGLTVHSIKLFGETYKPYRATRAITQAGRYQVRV